MENGVENFVSKSKKGAEIQGNSVCGKIVKSAWKEDFLVERHVEIKRYHERKVHRMTSFATT